MFENVCVSILAICGICALVVVLLLCVFGLFMLIADVFDLFFYDTCERIMNGLLMVLLFLFFAATIDGIVGLIHVVYCSIMTNGL